MSDQPAEVQPNSQTMAMWVVSDLEQRDRYKNRPHLLEAVKDLLGFEIEDIDMSAEQVAKHLRKEKSLEKEGDMLLSIVADEIIDLRDQFMVLEFADKSGFFSNVTLSRELLSKESLGDYVRAADSGKEVAAPFLEFLTRIQMQSNSKDNNLYASIVASSGTGKTQLAATASLTYKKAITIYLHVGQQGAFDTKEGGQRFYRPHISHQGSGAFFKSIDRFQSHHLKLSPREHPSAVTIGLWAKNLDVGTSLFGHFLYRILLQKEPQTTRIKFKELKKELVGKKFLVFLDEVPLQAHEEQYKRVLCLRDTLRYLGISPILMSTHSGAQDYVGSVSRSTTSPWAWVISRLPPFTPFKANTDLCLVESERPLVLASVNELIKDHEVVDESADVPKGPSFPELVSAIREKLQAAKEAAWTLTPALQLVQLFCTNIDINESGLSMAHHLVGHHFGSLVQVGEVGDCGEKWYSYAQAQTFGNTRSMAPVSPKYEPLLYMALVSWDTSMLKSGSKTMFPLVTNSGDPLTVRGAFKRCSGLFRAPAASDNLLAASADGNLLEALVHASCTLASMQTVPDGDQYLPGLSLHEFITLVRHFLVADKVGETLPAPPSFFTKDLDYDWTVVPALGGTSSGLSDEIARAAKSPIGSLVRPANMEELDGVIRFKREGERDPENHINIECKNYTGGVGASLLKEIFQKIKKEAKCSLIFVSSLQKNALANHTVPQLRKECFAGRTGVSVLLWKETEQQPDFLVLHNVKFRAKQKTNLLVVIIEVGLVSTVWEEGRKRKPGSLPPCANYPVAKKAATKED